MMTGEEGVEFCFGHVAFEGPMAHAESTETFGAATGQQPSRRRGCRARIDRNHGCQDMGCRKEMTKTRGKYC